MQLLKRLAVWSGALIAAGTCFLVLVVTFGAAGRRLVCSGEFSRGVEGSGAVKTPAKLYARVENYPWFIFWADHDAMIEWELLPSQGSQDFGVGYFYYSDIATPIAGFTRAKNGTSSSLSGRIYVESSVRDASFEGICT